MNIAIDGPAGAGKSTIAKLLAKRLNIVYLDTGAMYRAVGLKAFTQNIKLTDEAAVTKMLNSTKIDLRYENGEQKIFLDGEDVSQKIREHHISKIASDISKLTSVRNNMVELQRYAAKKGDTVLDGRDIGTYVLPNAEYKFFLVADISERAARRFKELQSKGIDCKLEDIKNDIAERDYNDSARALAPLKKADDAIEIDTTHLNIEEVCCELLKYIKL